MLHENKHDCKEGSCTHHIASSNGEIFSPNWPDSYPSRKDCAWLFTTTPGHRVKLVFIEFDVEPHQECAYDHIVVYDGASLDTNTLGRFCGGKLPHPLVSSTNRMFLSFKSDASVQRKGFKAAHGTVCGGRLFADTSIDHIYSHAKFGDHDYEKKEECEWMIEASEGKRIRLRFLSFDIEHEQDCTYDFVEVYDGDDDSSNLFGRFCGNTVSFFYEGDGAEVVSTSF